MAWACVDVDGMECVFQSQPIRGNRRWILNAVSASRDYVVVPDGTIEKILGHPLTWADEPVKLVEQ